MRKRLLYSLLTLIGLSSATLHAADNPHIVSKQISQAHCTDCHLKVPELKNDDIVNTNRLPADLDRLKPEVVATCWSCHPRDHVHKKVTVDFSLPADMPLSQDKEHICLTCHYTHGKLDSDQPQANVNFVDQLFDTERLHKSFLLRRDNSDGGLCLTCHIADDGSM